MDSEEAIRFLTGELDSTVVVEASAGTGKTYAMVKRIVALIASGKATTSDLAAITFTDAAAAELQSRIRDALKAEETSRCREALDHLSDATITTIHGFARNILAMFPIESGLPPSFEVADDAEGFMFEEDQWRQFLDFAFNDPSLEPIVSLGLTCGVDPMLFRDIARSLQDNWDRISSHPRVDGAASGVAGSVRPDGEIISRARGLLGQMERAVQLRSNCTSEIDTLAQRLDGARSNATELRRTIEHGDVLDVVQLLDSRNLTGNGNHRGKASNWDPQALDEARSCLQQAKQLAEELLAFCRQCVLDVLLDLIQRFTLESVEERKGSGRLRFHDLLVLARDLLRDNPAVRARIKRRYKAVLVDEFQDTDPLQLELAQLASGGTLFFVGDPKQSIYRFRGADLTVYSDATRDLSNNLVQLEDNWRSTRQVLNWVNHVFDVLIGEGIEGIQPRYLPIQPATGAQSGSGSVVTFGGAAEDDGRIGDLRAVEARDIARMCQLAVQEEWIVRDGESVRPARLGDIAILLRSRTGLGHILGALDDAGIPVSLETESLLLSTSEIADLLGVLRAVDNPCDAVAVVSALRSPYLGCSDSALAEYRLSGGSWDPFRSSASMHSSRSPVEESMDYLRTLHFDRFKLGVSGTVNRLLVERRAFELALERSDTADSWKRLRYLQQMARSFADKPGSNLRDFVNWVDALASGKVRSIESDTPSDRRDAVRILTIHGGKGLEFPIAIVPSMEMALPKKRYSNSVLWSEGLPQVRLNAKPGMSTHEFDSANDRESEIASSEMIRLLYVAVTRARDHLVVSLHHQGGEGDGNPGLTEALAHVCESAPDITPHLSSDDLQGFMTADAVAVHLDTAETAHLEVDLRTEDTAEARQLWIDERRSAIDRMSVMPTISATALAMEHQPKDRHRLEEDDFAGEPDFELDEGFPDDGSDQFPLQTNRVARTQRSEAKAIGKAVHAVLERVDLAGGSDVSTLSIVCSAAEGVEHRSDLVSRMVGAALESPTVARAASAGRYWREVFVGTDIGGTIFEGFVDLLVETEDGSLTVVDYKTDHFEGQSGAARLAERYSHQGAAYAMALQRSLGRPVSRCVFVFVNGATPIEIEVEELDQKINLVAGRVSMASR